MNRFIEVINTKTLILFIILSIFNLSIAKSASAQVVINEVFPNPSGPSSEPNEFVELMNISDEEINLEGYEIKDASGKDYLIESVLLQPDEFIAFRREETKIAFNNGGDEVFLFNHIGEEIDKFVYEKTIEDRSWSRVPDGAGNFFNGTEVSEGISNNPAPTSTPQPTPKPTFTPKPTKTPKPSPTARQTKNTTSNSLSSNNTNVLSEQSDSSEKFDTNDEGSKTATKEAGFEDRDRDHTVDKSDDESIKLDDNEQISEEDNGRFGAGFLLIGGLSFIGAAGYPIIRKKGFKNVFFKQNKE